MIKKRFLEPFKNTLEIRADLRLLGLDIERCTHFLESANDQQLQILGWAVFHIYPNSIRGLSSNHREKKLDYSFIDDFIKTYNISSKKTSKDKARGGWLVESLRRNPNLTATNFLK